MLYIAIGGASFMAGVYFAKVARSPVMKIIDVVKAIIEKIKLHILKP
jgi:hypothetical protein